MKKIILCATQRSGSTMVCDDLWNTGKLGKPDEYFIPWTTAKTDQYDWKIELEKIFERASFGNGVSAVKIMSDQVEKIEEKLRTFSDKIEAKPLTLLPHEFGDCIWVRIIRKNTIKQAISRSIARQTNVCHAVENSDDFFAGKTIKYNAEYNQNVKFIYESIIKDIHRIKKEELRWNKFFLENGITPIRVVYEDVIDAPESYLQKIVKKLDLDFNEIEIKPRKIKKLANNINKEWYINALEKYSEKLFVHGYSN